MTVSRPTMNNLSIKPVCLIFTLADVDLSFPSLPEYLIEKTIMGALDPSFSESDLAGRITYISKKQFLATA